MEINLLYYLDLLNFGTYPSTTKAIVDEDVTLATESIYVPFTECGYKIKV